MANSKKAKKLKSPFGNRIKKEAARKAAQGPDLGKTQVPELVQEAPKNDPNVIGLDEISGFTEAQHSADTEVLPDQTVPMPGTDIPPTEDAVPLSADVPPTETDVMKSYDAPKTETSVAVEPDMPPTEDAIPVGTDIPLIETNAYKEPSQEEKIRIAGLETQVLNLDDTDETFTFDGVKTEELDDPTKPIGVATEEKAKPGFWSRVPLIKYIVNYKSKSQKVEEELRRQAAEEGIPLDETDQDSGELVFDTEELVFDDDEADEAYVPTPTEPLAANDESTEVSETAEAGLPAEDATQDTYVQPEAETSAEEAGPKEVIIKPKKKTLIKRLFGPKKEKKETAPDAETAPPKIPESVANAVTEPLDVPEEPALVGEPENVYARTDTEPLTTVEDLEEVVEEAPRYVGVTVDRKYAPILMLAAGERAVINEDNKDVWEKALEDLDCEAETDPAKADLRNYIFAVYANARGAESKDKEILVYVLSELASANSEKGDHSKAMRYAERARELGKQELMKNPNANTLHKWGMLEHNIQIYEKEMQKNTVAAEAE